MATRKIVKRGDEVLTKICRPVEKFDKKLSDLIDDMAATMYKADGCGLAAPQVGLLRRIYVVDTGDGLIECVNPEITEREGEQREIEGCLSCPGMIAITRRPARVTVRAFDRKGREFTVTGEGLLARALCHEYDHLDGKTIYETAEKLMTQEQYEQYLEEISENGDK